MNKKKNYKIYKVDNPIYMNREDIEKKYWGNALVLTNIEETPTYDWAGGKVHYYAKYMNPLHKVLNDTIKNNAGLGQCGVLYVGDTGYLLASVWDIY